jgi:hypothetical protein
MQQATQTKGINSAKMTMGIRDQVVQTLVDEVTLMRAEIAKLRAMIGRVRTQLKPTITTYLQTLSIPANTFEYWFTNLQIKRKHIDEVLKHNLVDGMVSCACDGIRCLMESSEYAPIVSFTIKPNSVYVCVDPGEKNWIQLLPKIFEPMIKILTHKFMVKYNCYVAEFEGDLDSIMNHASKFFPSSSTHIRTANILIREMCEHVHVEVDL